MVALIIGAGPAGLMAAEQLAQAGQPVVVVEGMPSAGRKFLMAGKSGLNLTRAQDIDEFIKAYGDIPPHMQTALRDFGPQQICDWAVALGQEVFTGSTGRVFPKAMKASPLLRAWMARLGEMGVELRTRWHWDGWDDGRAMFSTPDGPQAIVPDVTVLALGGASWARLGSDGGWAAHLVDDCAPFQSANMGFLVDWSDHMRPHFGAPLKSIGLICGGHITRGECVISAQGLEGGGIYTVSKALREGADLALDLLPDWPIEKVRAALAKPRGKASLSNHLRKTLRLGSVQIALLMECGRPLPDDIAPVIKALPMPLKGPRPIDEAISTAGGVRFDALTETLMLRNRLGVFCAGEMLDWEAPTGGYLLSGCLATGRLAGTAAAQYAATKVT